MRKSTPGDGIDRIDGSFPAVDLEAIDAVHFRMTEFDGGRRCGAVLALLVMLHIPEPLCEVLESTVLRSGKIRQRKRSNATS